MWLANNSVGSPITIMDEFPCHTKTKINKPLYGLALCYPNTEFKNYLILGKPKLSL